MAFRSEMGDVWKEPSLHLPWREHLSLETQPPSLKTAVEATKSTSETCAAPPRPCCGRCGRRCCCALAAIVLLLATLLALFWPRDVTWHLVALDVEEPRLYEALSALPNPKAPLSFTWLAEVANPNLLAVSATESALRLTFDDQLVGQGTSEAAKWDPMSSRRVRSELRLRMEEPFLRRVEEELLKDTFTLRFRLQSDCRVSVVGVDLAYRMVCDLHVMLSELMMSETRVRAVRSSCSHSLSL